MNILLTNDDGYRAPGIQALYQVLSKTNQVILVAPDREKSAVGHGITLNQPLRVDEVDFNGAGRGYAVTGTPADCVKLGLAELCPAPPDLVISGINAGSNTGVNINYSGTVGAAREASLNKVPALAISIQYGRVMDFQGMAAYIGERLSLLAGLDMPPGTFLNINGPNIPVAQVRGFRLTSQDRDTVSTRMDCREDPRGKAYYWYQGFEPVSPATGSDNQTLEEKCISITPLQCDMTAHTLMEQLAKQLNGQWLP